MGKFLEIICEWSKIQSEILEDKTCHVNMQSLFWCCTLISNSNKYVSGNKATKGAVPTSVTVLSYWFCCVWVEKNTVI
jgi:hypothetical protein